MRFSGRFFGTGIFALGIILLACLRATPARAGAPVVRPTSRAAARSAQQPAPLAARPARSALPTRRALAECPSVQVNVLRTIDTKHATAGDRFVFATAYDIYVNLHKIARGTRGAGFIETLDHSRGGGRSGYLILNAQYLRLPGGKHIPVAIAPGSEGQSAAFVAAGRTDMPGMLGYTPLVAFTSAYNAFHHGKEAAVVAGARFPIIVGDGLAAGTCRVSWMP